MASMQNPQALPQRRVRLCADDPAALAEIQRERRPQYLQMGGQSFKGEFVEHSLGRVSLGYESWNCPIRVRCDRPVTYVALALPRTNAEARFCGVALKLDAVLQIDGPWDLATHGAFEYVSLLVDRRELERVETHLLGHEPTGSGVDAQLTGVSASALFSRFEQLLAGAGTLIESSAPVGAQRAFEAECLALAAAMRRVSRVEVVHSASRRRAGIARIEEYLDAHEGRLPSVADLCAVSGLSERSLEYACHETFGVTPHRYLRIRRLNRVREELRKAEVATVAQSAMRWGFWELGRFSARYKELFGEHPSSTLRNRLAFPTRTRVAQQQAAAQS